MTLPVAQARSFTVTRAIGFGALIVGVLDGLDAVIVTWARSGAPPTRVFQAVASGLLGRDAAFAGGIPAAALGLALHFLIAAIVVACYVFASRSVAVLRERPIICGVVYGVLVYVVMNFVVIPNSMIGGRAVFNTFSVVNGVLIHMFGVGLPAALVAARVGRT
jgi:hypothetical protein